MAELFKTLTVGETITILGSVLGAILLIAKGVVWSIEAYGKHITEPKMAKRRRQDEESHAPMMEKIDEITEVVLELQRVQREERDINKKVAKLSLAMADEHEPVTNGRTKEAKEELRQLLLERA